MNHKLHLREEWGKKKKRNKKKKLHCLTRKELAAGDLISGNAISRGRGHLRVSLSRADKSLPPASVPIVRGDSGSAPGLPLGGHRPSVPLSPRQPRLR